MKSIGKRIFLLAAVLVVGMPCTALAQERASRTPAPATPARDVAAPNAAEAQAEPTPAETAPRNVQTAPQRGILPEEIDRASRATDRSRAGQPTTIEASRRQAPAPAARRLSLQQMMTRLQPRQTGFIAARPSGPGGGAAGGPTAIQTRPAEPPRYEIAECGTAASPMICCHHVEGDGSSCNLFKILCENAGGKAQGDGESAACSDW